MLLFSIPAALIQDNQLKISDLGIGELSNKVHLFDTLKVQLNFLLILCVAHKVIGTVAHCFVQLLCSIRPEYEWSDPSFYNIYLF